MKHTILGQLQLSRLYYLLSASLIIGGGILGTLLFEIIMRVENAHSEEPTTFEMAFLIAAICGLIVLFSSSMSGIGMSFNRTVGMSRTRKGFFIGYTISCFLNSCICGISLLIVFLTEQWRLKTWWSAYPCETNFGVIFKPANFILMILLFTAAQELIGYLILRFEKKAFWVLWALWMLGAIGIPRVMGDIEEQVDSPLAAFGLSFSRAISGIPGIVWYIAGLAATFLCIGISYLGFRRQKVTA